MWSTTCGTLTVRPDLVATTGAASVLSETVVTTVSDTVVTTGASAAGADLSIGTNGQIHNVSRQHHSCRPAAPS